MESGLPPGLQDVGDTASVVTGVRPDCVIVNVVVAGVVPVPATVTTAILADVSGFAVMDALKFPLPFPLLGVNVTHVAGVEATQCVVGLSPEMVTVTDVLPAVFGAIQVVGASESVVTGARPDCVTDTTCDAGVVLFPFTVMVAVRTAVSGFAVTVAVKLPLPFPLVGFTVSQTALDTNDQLELGTSPAIVTVTFVAVAVLGGLQVNGETFKVVTKPRPACVTDTVRVDGVVPVPVIVTIAERAFVSKFAVVVNVILPEPLPLNGATVNHVWFDDAVHGAVK